MLRPLTPAFFFQLLSDALRSVLSRTDTDTLAGRDSFITCTHAICNVEAGYPPFGDQLLSRVLYLLPNVNGEMQTRALEILMWRADSTPALLRELQGKNLPGLLRRNVRKTQAVVLATLKALCSRSSVAEVAEFLPFAIAGCEAHADVQVRTLLFQLLMTVYDLGVR
jgi:hypothetical protein